MKTFQKNFIGKGKKVADMNIIRISIRLQELEAIAYEFEGTQYVTFEVAEMMHPDQFGRTHTVYHNQLVDEPSQEIPVGQPKKKRNRKQKEAEPIPF